MKQIKSIDLTRLANGAHFLFITDITECAEADEKLKTKAPNEIAALKKALKAEDDALKQSQKSLLSDDIKAADQRRDALYRTLKKAIDASADFPVEATAKAGMRLRQLLKDYNINPQMQLDRETGMLINLITDLTGKFAADVTLLGLTALLTELTTVNQQLRAATKQRANDRMFKIIGQLKLARAASDQAYHTLVVKANALAVIEGEADYESFIAYVNEEVKHYKETSTRPSPKEKENKPKPDGDKKTKTLKETLEKMFPAFEKAQGLAEKSLSYSGHTAKLDSKTTLYLLYINGDTTKFIWVKMVGKKLVKVNYQAGPGEPGGVVKTEAASIS